MNKLITLMSALFIVLLTACSGTTITPDTPPEIVYGEDVCDQCGMIISDERFAASVVIETAPSEFEHRIFDDIGGMFEFVMENNDIEIASYYVHDYSSREWLDARDAYFVKSDGLLTPMSFGLVACAQQVDAEVLAREWNGDVLTFTELHEVLFGSIVESHMDHD